MRLSASALSMQDGLEQKFVAHPLLIFFIAAFVSSSPLIHFRILRAFTFFVRKFGLSTDRHFRHLNNSQDFWLAMAENAIGMLNEHLITAHGNWQTSFRKWCLI